MYFNLQRNAILCLDEAWKKFNLAEKDNDQYLFAFKELSSFIEIYSKFIIKEFIEKNIPNDNLCKLEFLETFNKLKPDCKNYDKKNLEEQEKINKFNI